MDKRNGLVQWLNDRPKWQQEALRMLYEAKDVDDVQLQRLYKFCIDEAENNPIDDLKGIPTEWLTLEESERTIRLSYINDPVGINNLNPQIPLQFGNEQLCVIYGENGVGKSGYVRILKRVGSNHQRIKILDNVYETTSVEQACNIGLQIDGSPLECHCQLNNDDFDSSLNSIDVFDSEISMSYLKDAKTAIFEPVILQRFEQLSNLCKRISVKIEEEISRNTCDSLIIPNDLENTGAIQFYKHLSSKTNSLFESAKKTYKWEEKLEKALKDIEILLRESNPVDVITKLKQAQQNTKNLKDYIGQICNFLCEEEQRNLIEFFQNYNQAKQYEDEGLMALSETCSLPVNSAIWKSMWEAAKRYSEQIAYQSKLFPFTKDDGKCVLCQQPFSENARQRMGRLDEFIRNELSNNVKVYEKKLVDKIKSLPEIKSRDHVEALCVAGTLSASVKEKVNNFNQFTLSIFTDWQNYRSLDKITKYECSLELIQVLQLNIDYIEGKIIKYSSLIDDEKRKKLLEEFKELKGHKWFADNIASIEKEYKCKKRIVQLSKAKKLSNSKGITDMKKNLSQELITDAYVQRLNTEMSELGIRGLEIALGNTTGSGGKVLRELTLKKAKKKVLPIDVLSEGEIKIVSIAAFLADALGKPINAPLVLDDPISSLDAKYEQSVINRLVGLSKTRQVIVFTHRLSLAIGLRDIAKDNSTNINIVELLRYSWGAGVPCQASFNKNVKTRLNELKDKRLLDAKKYYEKDEHGLEYLQTMENICREFRVCLEDFISDVLLNGIVKRFDAALHTDGKLQCLSDINYDECTKLQNLMSKYSFTVHSQSVERKVISYQEDDPDFSMACIKKDLEDVLTLYKLITVRRTKK